MEVRRPFAARGSRPLPHGCCPVVVRKEALFFVLYGPEVKRGARAVLCVHLAHPISPPTSRHGSRQAGT
jgi:hypothetical protein